MLVAVRVGVFSLDLITKGKLSLFGCQVHDLVSAFTSCKLAYYGSSNKTT